MTDLAQQIREQLDGWAPPADGGPPPQFVEILDPGDLTQEQIEDWQQRWDEIMVTAVDRSLHILATAPRFYPGFEQMRAAILAAVELHEGADEELLTVDGGAEWGKTCQECHGGDLFGSSPCATLKAIAKALGIEVDHG